MMASDFMSIAILSGPAGISAPAGQDHFLVKLPSLDNQP